MTLINALKNNLLHSNVPFNHWIINNPLSEKAIDEIYSINFPDGNVSHGMTEFYSYDHTHTPVACNQAMDVVFLIDYTGSMINTDMNLNSGNKYEYSF